MTSEDLTSSFVNLRPRLKALADRILSSEDEADDAVQEAFYRVWRTHAHDSEPASTKVQEGRLVTTLRNLCLDMLRRNSVRRAMSIDDPERTFEPSQEPEAYGSEEQERAQTLAAVEALMADVLTSRQREILLMRDRDGCEMKQIAEHFGMTEANVRIVLSRSRKAIRTAYIQTRKRV